MSDNKRSKVEVGPIEARYYDLMLDFISFGRYSHFIKKAVEKMEIKPEDNILDLGSGTGKNDCFMTKYIGNNGRILGLDISEVMMRIARKRCQQYPNVQFQKQRIEEPLSYKEKFDKVFISFVFHGFEDDKKVKIIDNAYKALKPEGIFYILDYNQFDISNLWFPYRWLFTKFECELATEFLDLDLKGMLSSRGFCNFEEKYFLKKYVRLLKAVKGKL